VEGARYGQLEVSSFQQAVQAAGVRPLSGNVHIFFLAPFNLARVFLFVYLLPKSTIENAQRDLEGVFCDFHKAPAQICSLKG
jgi:hypothetical protein